MTAQDFVARYIGREVRVNNYYRGTAATHLIGLNGIVSSYAFLGRHYFVRVVFDPKDADSNKGYLFEVDELDVIDNGPLPLPG